MRRNEPIHTVAVAGDGVVAWSAAAALRRRLPWLEVTLVRSPVAASALADRVASTLPSILGFHGDLGLGDDDAVLRAGGAWRLGTAFAGFVDGRPGYFHGYDAHGRPFGAGSFSQHWIKVAKEAGAEAAPFDAHSPAAALALAGRFAPASDAADAPLGRFEYGLVLDPPRYRQMLRAFALHIGVREAGELADVERQDDGAIAALRTSDGRVDADLFVDATGPAALLRAPMGGTREDWSAQLLCDRVAITDAPPAADLPPYDRVDAIDAGWRWSASAPGRGQTGVCFSSAHLGDDAARALVDDAAAPLAPGLWVEPWAANCIAVGDAAVAIEPLEWANLHLAHSAIDRIVAMLPDRDCAPIERAEYNRQCTAEAMRVRDFVLLHYVVARRSSPFWRDAAQVALPPSLAHTLTQFRERGRLPFYEEETFASDSWAAVLLGQAVLPRRVDPLIEDVDAAETARALAERRRSLTRAAAAAPTHKAYHELQMRRIAR